MFFSAVANRSALSIYPIRKTDRSDLQIRGAGVEETVAGKILSWLGVRANKSNPMFLHGLTIA